jgi:hypothetical protein
LSLPTITLTIDGSAVDLDLELVSLGPFTAYSRGGHASLTLYRRGGALRTLPDPWAAKAVTLSLDDGSGPVLSFSGDVVSGPEAEHHDDVGWVQAYQCLGLTDRADRVPVTDDNTGLDSIPFNQQPESPSYLAARAGRTVGQILTTVLTMKTNAQNLGALGIGNYTGLPSAPALPSATTADLAALTMIPPSPLEFGGEKLWTAVVGFCQQWAPKSWPHIEPGGNIRFLDTTAFANHTFTMDTDPVEPARLSRRYGDCYPRVLVRGQPVVRPYLVSLQNGGLTEDFGYTTAGGTTVTSASAKAAFLTGQRSKQGDGTDSGTCTCPTTTTVTVTSADSAKVWGANALDQSSTGGHCRIYLWDTAGSGLNQGFSADVLANTAKVAGGTSTLTLAEPMPVTSYNRYVLYQRAGGLQNVYTKYLAANATIRAALAQQFTGTVPFILASGNSATLVSSPTGSVVWPATPGNEVCVPITVDPSTGNVYFCRSLYELCGNAAPYDVRVLLAVNTGQNRVASPADGLGGVPNYSGTSHTVEGLARTLVVTLNGWRDPLQASQVQAYADDLQASLRDTVVEGTVAYLGYNPAWLTPGTGVSIGGPTTTGWEGLNLPVLEATIADWQAPSGLAMTARCSNRKHALSSGAYLHPERAGATIGGDFNPFGMLLDAASQGFGGPAHGGGSDEGEGMGMGMGMGMGGFGDDFGPAPVPAPRPPSSSGGGMHEAPAQTEGSAEGAGSGAAIDQVRRDMADGEGG